MYTKEEQRAYHRKYYLAHKEIIIAKATQYAKDHPEIRKKCNDNQRPNRIKRNLEQKLAFHKMYGEVCGCCGEHRLEFLTMEHILGLQGKKRRSTMEERAEALKEYRPDLYRTLCMNCNTSLGFYGYCPHVDLADRL